MVTTDFVSNTNCRGHRQSPNLLGDAANIPCDYVWNSTRPIRIASSSFRTHTADSERDSSALKKPANMYLAIRDICQYHNSSSSNNRIPGLPSRRHIPLLKGLERSRTSHSQANSFHAHHCSPSATRAGIPKIHPQTLISQSLQNPDHSLHHSQTRKTAPEP
jgi:hypothetical protein